MVKTLHGNMNTTAFSDYHAKYKELSPNMQRMVRNIASLELQERGVYEIGSSDVSCAVYDLYCSLGSFENIIKHGLTLA